MKAMKIDARIATNARIATSEVDVIDESGRKIGTATVDGERVVATISDKAAAAAILARPQSQSFSVGYTVGVVAKPSEKAIAVPVDPRLWRITE